MPRNISGVYTLPAGNPVVTGTVIETAWANPTMSDIAQALTDSLPRNGAAPMTGALILSGNAVLALAATPLQQVQALDTAVAVGAAAALATHEGDPTDAHDASAISNVPAGGLAATDVQAALNELDTEKVAKAGDTMTGNLGMGGAAAAKVHIFAPANNGLRLTSSDGVTFQSIVYNTNDTQLTLGTVTNHPLTFFTNNTVRGQIDAGGRFVIGTGASSGTAFEVFDGTTRMTLNPAGAIGSFGTITNHPLAFFTNNTEKARLDINGLFGIGGTPSNKLHVFAAANDGVRLTSTNGITFQAILFNTNDNQLTIGTVTNHPIDFFTNNVSVARVDATGNVRLRTATGGLGYETGAGGTVVQATSKATGVTINRPTGRITTASDALAAGAIVAFLVTNSVVAAGDNVILTRVAGPNEPAYNMWSVVQGGAFAIYIKNISAGSLSDALGINFTILKGALS